MQIFSPFPWDLFFKVPYRKPGAALCNAAERPIFRTIYVAKNHKSLAGHLRLISTHALRCKCIYLPSRSPKMLSMTFISAIHWPESSRQSPQRCQCLEVLPMALPPIFFCLELHYSARNAKNFLDAMPLATPPSIGNVVDFDQMIRANHYHM